MTKTPHTRPDLHYLRMKHLAKGQWVLDSGLVVRLETCSSLVLTQVAKALCDAKIVRPEVSGLRDRMAQLSRALALLEEDPLWGKVQAAFQRDSWTWDPEVYLRARLQLPRLIYPK